MRKCGVDRSTRGGRKTTQKLITATRAFLLYLSFRGECPVNLDQAVPALARWRLGTLPRCLTAEVVERIIAACCGSSIGRLRDRAIILMLGRLAARASDLAQLRPAEFECEDCGL